MKNWCKLIKEKTTIKVETILEIGSRDADDANIIKNELGLEEKNIYVVEPNPVQCKLISKKYPNFNLIKNAIFDKEGRMDFYAVGQMDYEGISSLLDRKDHLYDRIISRSIEVDVITGKKLINIINKDIDM